MTLQSYHSARNWHSSRRRTSGAFAWPLAWSLPNWMLSRRMSLWATKVEHFYTTLASPLSRPTLWKSITSSPIRSGWHRSWRISIRKALESSPWAAICMRSGVCCTRWASISHLAIVRWCSLRICYDRSLQRKSPMGIFNYLFRERTLWNVRWERLLASQMDHGR